MINLDKKHYAITIETDSNISNIDLGIDSGVFRFTTEGYQPDYETDAYEDETLVTGNWYGDLLNKDGIKTSTQSIDIIIGGDYAFASSLSIEIVNFNQYHKKLLTTNDLYIIGSKMTMYVIIDGVWYSRWVGSVSDYVIDEGVVVINGKDINNSETNILKDYAFGSVYLSYNPIEENLKLISFDQSIKCISMEANENYIVNNKYNTTIENGEEVVEPYLSRYDLDSEQLFNGFCHFSDYKITHTNDLDYELYLNGQILSITKGMYIKFNTSDNYYVITKDPQIVYMGTWTNDAGVVKEFYSTVISLNELPVDLLDYSQFFGRQPNLVHGDAYSTQIVELTESLPAATEKITLSVYEEVFTFKKINDNEFVKEGDRFVGIDENGNEVLIDGEINSDGDLVVLRTTASKPYFPEKIIYHPINSDQLTAIENGSFKGLDSLPTTVFNPAQDLEINGKFTKTNFTSAHMFRMTFADDLEIKDKIPFVVLNNLTGGGTYAWNDNVIISEFNEHFRNYAVYYDDDINPVTYNMDSGSVLPSTISSNSEYLHNSMFPQYEVSVWKVYTNPDFGDCLQLVEDSSFYVTNMNTIVSKTNDSHYEYNRDYTQGPEVIELKTHINSVGVTSTNLPLSSLEHNVDLSVNNYAISGFDNLTWLERSKYKYPNGQTTGTNGVPLESNTKELIIIIKPFSETDIEIIRARNDGIAVNKFVINNDFHFSLGLNSIGVYSKADVGTLNSLKIKTKSSTVTTLQDVLNDLSGSTSVLVNRDSWFVGGQVLNETNKFGVITTLCKQSFVGGYTDRKGMVSFKEFLENSSINHTHNNYNIVDGSISSFKLSPIEKCFNEFTIKYNSNITDKEKVLSVGNIESASFPAATTNVWQVPEKNELITSNVFVSSYFDSAKNKWVFLIKVPESFTIDNPNFNTELTNSTVKGIYVIGDLDFEGTYYKKTATLNDIFYYFDPVVNDFPHNGGYYPIQFNQIEYYQTIDTDYSEYVTGIDDYVTAKAAWEKAHSSWLLNKRIRIAPTERTYLEYAIDRNSFYNSTSYDSSVEYAMSYFNLFLDWTTRQKLQVNYNIPITDSNINLELLDTISLHDAIITPDIGEFGKGWITSIQVDPRKNEFKLGITFETNFFTPPSAIDQCTEIIETGYNLIDIVETGTSQIDIVEGICGR